MNVLYLLVLISVFVIVSCDDYSEKPKWKSRIEDLKASFKDATFAIKVGSKHAAAHLFRKLSAKFDKLATKFEAKSNHFAKEEGYEPAVNPGYKEEFKPELKPDYKEEYKPDVKPDYKEEFKPEVKPGYKEEFKPEVKPDYKEEYKPEYKPDVKPDYITEDFKPDEYKEEKVGKDKHVLKPDAKETGEELDIDERKPEKRKPKREAETQVKDNLSGIHEVNETKPEEKANNTNILVKIPKNIAERIENLPKDSKLKEGILKFLQKSDSDPESKTQFLKELERKHEMETKGTQVVKNESRNEETSPTKEQEPKQEVNTDNHGQETTELKPGGAINQKDFNSNSNSNENKTLDNNETKNEPEPKPEIKETAIKSNETENPNFNLNENQEKPETNQQNSKPNIAIEKNESLRPPLLDNKPVEDKQSHEVKEEDPKRLINDQEKPETNKQNSKPNIGIEKNESLRPPILDNNKPVEDKQSHEEEDQEMQKNDQPMSTQRSKRQSGVDYKTVLQSITEKMKELSKGYASAIDHLKRQENSANDFKISKDISDRIEHLQKASKIVDGILDFLKSAASDPKRKQEDLQYLENLYIVESKRIEAAKRITADRKVEPEPETPGFELGLDARDKGSPVKADKSKANNEFDLGSKVKTNTLDEFDEP